MNEYTIWSIHGRNHGCGFAAGKFSKLIYIFLHIAPMILAQNQFVLTYPIPYSKLIRVILVELMMHVIKFGTCKTFQ